MTRPNGIHHLALSTADMKEQIKFFTDVLGMKLVALYWMHGVEGCWHGFLELNENSAIAFVFHPNNAGQKVEIGHTHSGNGGGSSAPGTLQHIAFNVDTQAELLALRDRIRSRGVPVIGPIEHGMCSSVYFAGPENLTLEISTSADMEHPLDHEGTWIDQEVVELAGISAEELKTFMNPDPFEGQNGSVPQPQFDPAKPHMDYPKEVYDAILNTPDKDLSAAMNFTTPPNA